MLHHFLRATRANSQDPYFKQVALLLHGDGTNGSQNNTFLDSSTNNFSITRNGNTTQGTFSPFSLPAGQWSNFFDGNGDYLSVGNVGSLAGDFTVECWVYFNNSGQVNKNFYLGKPSSSGTGGASFGTFSTADRLQFGASGIAYDVSSTNTIPIRQWVHIAATRSGSTLRLFINGVNDGSVTQTRTYLGDIATVGGNVASATQSFDGYISNMRVVSGTALYTSNFTPPTTPLTAISGTSLLTCQSNRFVDNSSNNFTLTRNGDVRATAFSPFAPTSAYSPSVNGGSGYFDGTGDYITAPTTGVTLSSDFTIEGWVYINSAANRALVTVGDDFVSNGALFYVTSAGRLAIYGANASILVGTTQTVNINSWNHISFVRSSGTIRAYLNGVADATTASKSTSFTGTSWIGVERYNGSLGATIMNGYISNFRIVNGTAVYTSNFTPPTAPLTAITNTSLLLNFTNAGIVDSSAKNVIETVGNAQISTSVTKFGTGSLSFDGNGDYLTMPARPETLFGTSPFTIEFWFYPTDVATARALISKGTSSSSTNWQFIHNNTGQLAFLYNNLTTLTCSTSLSINTWYHVALVGNRTSIVIYLNGVQDGSVTYTYNYSDNSVLRVGVNRATNTYTHGYIDDLRITNGIARYTSAGFTPPQGPYPNQ